MDLHLKNLVFRDEHEAYRIAVNIDRLLDYRYNLTEIIRRESTFELFIDPKMTLRDRWIVLEFLKRLGVQ